MSCATPQAALERVRDFATHRRLRFDDFFTDFDRLHTGRITVPQFCRVLTLNHVKLTEDEMVMLASAFAAVVPPEVPPGTAAKTDNGAVDYTAFLRALRGRASGAAAERCADDVAAAAADGLDDTAATTASTSRPRRSGRLTQQEEDALRPTVQILRHAIRSRGLDILPPFRDLDPLHTSAVTPAQFERCLPLHDKLSPEAIELFVRKYSDGKGGVAYKAWCADMDDAAASRPASAAAAAGCGATATASSHDGGGGSSSSTSRLRRTAGGEEQEEGYFIRCFGLTQAAEANRPQLSAEELIRVLRDQFAIYRLRCEDSFADHDRARRGTVSAAQFKSVLGALKLVKVKLTEEDMECLVEAYTVSDPEPALGDGTAAGCFAETTTRVDYHSFLYDTNIKNFTHATELGSTNAFTASIAPDAFILTEADRVEVAQVVAKVRRLVSTSRVFLSPILKDFDQVQKSIYEHRICTRSRFARALAMQNIMLPPHQLNLLLKKYTVANTDGTPSDEVNYYQFVRDVDATLGAAAATTTTTTTATHAAGSARAAIALQKQQLQQGGDGAGECGGGGSGRDALRTVQRPATAVDEILQTIAQQCEVRSLPVGGFFPDFDGLRSGSLARSHFVSALTIAGVIELSQAELDALCEAFPSAKMRGGVDGCQFLRALSAFAPYSVPSCLSCTTPFERMTMKAASNSARAVAAAEEAASSSAGLGAGSVCGTAALTPREEEHLLRILKRLRQDAHAHNALLGPFFSDFDRFGRGKITASNFRQALSRHRFVLSEADTALLVKVYADEGAGHKRQISITGDPVGAVIDYRKFVQDVSDERTANYTNNYGRTAAAAAAALLATTTTGGGGGGTGGCCDTHDRIAGPADAVTLADALAHVCCYLQERRPRVSEFFPDGDELRHGVVTRARFRHCLAALGLVLSEEEMQVLEENFAVAAAADFSTAASPAPALLGEVDYPCFVRTVRGMLSRGAGLAAVQERRQGTFTATNGHATAAAATAAAAAATTTGEAALLEQAMERIRRILASRHGATLPAFRECDRTRRGFLREGDFFACLNSVLGGGGARLSPEEAGAIAKSFSIGNGEMGYVRFSAAVDSAGGTNV